MCEVSVVTVRDVSVVTVREVSVVTVREKTKHSKFFYSPTDAQVNCLKNNIKIYIKTATTCFGAFTPSSGSSLSVLATYAATAPPI